MNDIAYSIVDNIKLVYGKAQGNVWRVLSCN